MKTSCRTQRVIEAVLFCVTLFIIAAIITPELYAQGNPPRLTPYTITTVAGGATAPTEGTTGYSGGTLCGAPWPASNTGLTGPNPNGTWPTPPYDTIGDGCLANQAFLNAPRYAIPDPFGTLWVLDTGNGFDTDVRFVNPLTGIITAYNFGGTLAPNDNSPRGIAFDVAGNTYYMGENKSKGWKIDYITGTIRQFAGNISGGSGCSGDDVPALGDGIDNPSGVAVDSLGNIYFADNKCFRVRRIDTTGMMWEVIGLGAGVCTSTGIAGTTGLNTPYAVAVDPYGNLYVANQTCYTLMEVLVDPTTVNAYGVGYATKKSQVVVLAGTGAGPSGYFYPQMCYGNMPCGLGTTMPIEPSGVQVDPEGPVTDANGNLGYNLFIQEGSHVWYYDFATKWIRRIAGGNANCSWASDALGDDCPASNSTLATAYGIDVDALGNLYVGDDADNVIRKIFKGTQLTDGSALWLTAPYVSEYGTGAYQGTGVAAAHFGPGDYPSQDTPFQVFGNFSLFPYVVDDSGTVQFSPDCTQNSTADGSWDCLFSINFNATRPGTVTAPLEVMGASTASLKGYSLAGTVNYPAIALDPGEVTLLSSSVSNPGGVAVDSLGNWYVADTGNNRILKNGLVLVSGLNAPQGVAVDGAGNVYIADTGNNLVKEWNALTGAVTTAAGGSTPCSVTSWTFSSDSLGNNCLATQATLNHPTALAVDALLNLYILDQGNAEIRRVDPKSKAITLVAGGGGANIPECAGYNPHPRCATLVSPVALAVGAPGLVFVVEGGSSNDIKEINLLNFPATINQVAISSGFTNPSGVGVDAAGNIYYADAGYQVVGMANALGSGVDQLVLGIAGTAGGSAIAPGSVANTVALNGPAVLAVDPSGNVYISDVNNNRILKVDRTQSAVQFGEVAPGTGVVSSNITATNIGTQPLVLQPLSVSGTNARDFGIYADTGACSTTPLASGASCEVTAQAKPVDSGPLTASVVLPGNAMNTPVIQLVASGGGTPTSTALSFNPLLTVFGQSSTMAAQVTPAGCTGNVTFTANNELFGTTSLTPSTGTASLAFPWSDRYLQICCSLTVQALYTDPSGSCSDSQATVVFSISGGTITPVKPTLTLSLSCPSATYDGTVHSCTGMATGAGGASVAGSWTYSLATEVNAGIYPVTGTFTSGDPNYTGGTASGTLVVYPAWPTVTVNCPTVTYDGNPHSCTASASGAGGAPVSGTWSYSLASATTAGGYLITAAFTSTDPNYLNTYGTGILTINPALGINPAWLELNFLPEYAGFASEAQYIELTNYGQVPIAVSGASVTNTWKFPIFFISDQAGTCTSGMILQPAQSCVIRVVFDPPTDTGPVSEAMVIKSPGAAGGSYSLTLSGTGLAGTVTATLSATTITFPNSVMVGSSAPAQYVQITSTGTVSLRVTGVMVLGANPGDFTVTDQAGTCAEAALLVYNAKCNLRVTFTPTAVGSRSAILYIKDDGSGSPQQVSLSGTAISGAQLSVSATTLTFPATTVGTTAATQYITLKSTGFQPVVVNQVVLSSGDFDLSDQAGTCTTAATTSLVPGADCNIRVKFHPTATGARTATVTINDNTATSPHTVMLNGTGQ